MAKSLLDHAHGMKTQKKKKRSLNNKSFQVGEYIEVLGGRWYTQRGRGGSVPLTPVPCLMQLSHLAIPELHSLK